MTEPSNRWRFFIANPRRVHFLIVLALLFSGIQYRAAVMAHFNFDDYELIVLNPTIRDFKHLPAVLASGRPVRGITLMIDYALFGLDPMGYHLHNLFWHLLGIVLFYALIARIFGRPRLAGAAAAFFAFHPIHSEAVMAIAHRKELLAFCFIMLSYHAYLYRPRYPAWSIVFSALFFMLAVLSKQVAIVLPLLLIGHEWLKSGAALKPRYFLWAAPFLFIGLFLILGGLLIQGPILRDFNLFGSVAPAGLMEIDYPRILATSFSVYPRHLRYLLFPVHQCAAPVIEASSWASARAWFGLLLFIGLMLSAIRARKDFLVSFSLFWVFICLLPIMNWIPSNAFFAERYLYIPSAGVCLLLAGMWERLFLSREKLFGERGYKAASFLVLFALLWMFIYSPFAFRINAIWPKEGQYYLDRSVAFLTASMISALVGSLLFFWFRGRRISSAIERRAWAELIFTYLIMALLMLGAVLAVELIISHHFGLPERDFVAEWGKMRDWLSRHARPGRRSGGSWIYPYGTPAAEWAVILFYMVGGAALVLLVFRRLGRMGERSHINRKLAWEIISLILLALITQNAYRLSDWVSEVRLWRYTVMEEPRSLLGWNNLGKAYMERRRYVLAAEAYEKTVELDPDGAENYRNLGIALSLTGDYKKAKPAYEKAIELAPGDMGSRNNLANILVVEAGRKKNPGGYQKAVQHYLKILEYDPGNAHAHYNLAWCYFKLGALGEAERENMRALHLNPRYDKSLWLREQIIKARSSGQRLPGRQ